MAPAGLPDSSSRDGIAARAGESSLRYGGAERQVTDGTAVPRDLETSVQPDVGWVNLGGRGQDTEGLNSRPIVSASAMASPQPRAQTATARIVLV